MNLASNLAKIRANISQACAKAGRDVESVKLLPVTKTVSEEIVLDLIQLGLNEFGENRVQQGAKRATMFPQAKWHLIGTLQTNKAKYCQGFTLIHSLDSLKLAQQLETQALRRQEPIDVLIQVNISRESVKHGVAAEDTFEFAKIIHEEFAYLNLRGLMGMAPFVQPEGTRRYFRELAGLYTELASRIGPNIQILSMGMSNDYQVAVEEGSTLVRIGSALFEGEV